MSKTVILINPMGTDVTPWVNGSMGSWKLLKGTILEPGDTLYTLPYKNQSGYQNIVQCENLLDAKIRSTAGQLKVVAYSEGGQGSDLWITNNADEAYASDRLSFLSIANANRVYGGFAYGHPEFSTTGFVGGLPSTVPWPYVDFSRQYDGVSDFPTDPDIHAALAKIQGSLSNPNAQQDALSKAMSLVPNGPKRRAAMNALWGMIYVHNWYFNVAPGDAGNTTYTAPSGVVYELAGTFPVPSLGTGVTVASKDASMRAEFETLYNRPMATPTPKTKDYGFGIKGPA